MGVRVKWNSLFSVEPTGLAAKNDLKRSNYLLQIIPVKGKVPLPPPVPEVAPAAFNKGKVFQILSYQVLDKMEALGFEIQEDSAKHKGKTKWKITVQTVQRSDNEWNRQTDKSKDKHSDKSKEKHSDKSKENTQTNK